MVKKTRERLSTEQVDYLDGLYVVDDDHAREGT